MQSWIKSVRSFVSKEVNDVTSLNWSKVTDLASSLFLPECIIITGR